MRNGGEDGDVKIWKVWKESDVMVPNDCIDQEDLEYLMEEIIVENIDALMELSR